MARERKIKSYEIPIEKPADPTGQPAEPVEQLTEAIEIPAEPIDISETPIDISEAHIDISEAPISISEASFEMPEISIEMPDISNAMPDEEADMPAESAEPLEESAAVEEPAEIIDEEVQEDCTEDVANAEEDSFDTEVLGETEEALTDTETWEEPEEPADSKAWAEEEPEEYAVAQAREEEPETIESDEWDEGSDEWDEEEELDEEPETWDEEDEPEEPVRPARTQQRPASKPVRKSSKPTGKKKKKHVALFIIAAIILVFILAVVIGLGEMNGFKSHAKKMKADLKSVVYCIKDDDFDGAEQAMEEVDTERIYLRDKINDPFWSLVGKLPILKSDIQAVNQLLDIVDDACNQIVHPFIVQAKGHPLSDLKAEGGFNVSLINSYLDFAETIVPVVDEMAQRISSIEFGPISKGAVGDYTEKLESLIETYEHFKKYIPLVEAFCGHGEDKFYIMLAQNSAEIRASGGYPGSMGIVRIEDGVLEIGDFMSVYDLLPMGQAFDSGITDQEIQLFGYMYAGEAHDACFNPHFARVGEITKASYDEYNEGYVDGIISLTPAVIQDILALLGESITLDDGSVLDGTNATRIIQRDLYIIYQGVEGYAFVNNDYVDSLFAETAKQAMSILVDNFKLEKLPEYVKLFEHGFENRTIMLWLADPDEEELVEAVGASGNLNNDKNNPKAGIYFSVCDPSKLGMFVEILPELSEPTILPDGSREYTMTVTLNNYLNEYLDKYFINSWFVLGGYGGNIQSYVYFFAPAGGTVSDFEVDSNGWNEVMLDEYEDLEVGYMLNLFLVPDEPVTVTYKVTTAPGVETPLGIDMTPTLQDYR